MNCGLSILQFKTKVTISLARMRLSFGKSLLIRDICFEENCGVMGLKRTFALLLSIVFSASSFATADTSDSNEDGSLTTSTGSKSVVLLEEDEEEKELPGFFDGFAFSGSFGLSLYYGDLANYDVFPKTRYFSDYFRSGWRLNVMRDIKWGLGAQLTLDKGTLEGGRQPGLNSRHVSFRSQYHGVSLSAQYDLDRLLLPRGNASDRRFWLDGQIGVGLVWFRSYLYDTNTLLVDNFYGYEATANAENLTISALNDRVEFARSWKMPLGVTAGYQLNYKTDLIFTVSQVTIFSDEMDSWVRDWSARDKYGYFGFGLKYNFNRGEDDMPEKKERKRRGGNDGSGDWSGDAGSTTGAGPNDINVDENFRSGRGLNLRKKKGRGGKGSDDELLDVRLKMFEIQLKLFEMQYLLQ